MTRPTITTPATGAPIALAPDVHAQGPALARFARACIAEALGGPRAPHPVGAWATAPAMTFVTLHWRDGDLQGCIGSLAPVRGLVDDVARNAVAAALRDPRGERLTLADVDRLDVEVSILSPMEPLTGASEAEILAQVRPGIDGLVLEVADRSGTLLPAVWDGLPDRAAFWAALKRKAGLPRHYWSPDVRVARYTVARYVDHAPAPAPHAAPSEVRS